jgi:DNA-binding PadR family transcriptional regulator
MMTNAELAVLSLVVENPRYGYDIENVIEVRGMREWTEIGFSSIYYLLKKLEHQGWIEAHLEPATGRGPARKVYRATPAGMHAFQAGVLEALSIPRRAYPSLLLGLACVPGVPHARAVEALRHYRAALTERLAHVGGRQAAQRPLPYFVVATFDYSLAMLRAELAWIEDLIKQMEGRNEQARSQEGTEAPVSAVE